MPSLSVNYTVPLKSVGPILLVFVVIGAAFLIAASVITLQRYTFLKTAIELSGEVVKLERRNDVFYPVVLYKGPDGKSRTLYGSSGSNPPSFYEGQRVAVLVDPKDPNYPLNAHIKSFAQFWGLSAFFGFMGSIFVFLPSMIWFIKANGARSGDREATTR